MYMYTPLDVGIISNLIVVTPENLCSSDYLGKCWGLVGKIQFFTGLAYVHCIYMYVHVCMRPHSVH